MEYILEDFENGINIINQELQINRTGQLAVSLMEHCGSFIFKAINLIIIELLFSGGSDAYRLGLDASYSNS